MIVFADVLGMLAGRGYTSYRLHKEGILSGSTIDRLRRKADINTATLDVICSLLQCQPGELISWVPDEERE